jgi:ABC-type transport system involved in multi-copper enzyme maturation permease subunit
MSLERGLGDRIQSAFAIAETVWKRVLDRTLGLVLLGGGALVVGLGATVELHKSEVGAAYLLIQVFVSVLVIFIGTTEIPRDRATRTIQVFLSKPLGRGLYLLGKFAGLVILAELLLAAYLGCLALGLGVRGLLDAGELGRNLVCMPLQLATLCALVVWLSVMLPEIAATIFGVVAGIVSYVIFILPPLARLVAPDWLHPVLLLGYLAVPNAQHYLWNGSADARFFGLLALYSVCYSLCALAVASFWFRRRDLL